MQDDMVVEIRLSEGGKPVKATAEVSFSTPWGELTIAGLRVIHQEDKEPWVALPDIRYKDRETGEYRSFPVIIPSRRLKKAITELVLAKYTEASSNAAQ